MKTPLLSQVIVGRNDNYLGNFKQRLEIAVNYTCRNIERSGNLGDYELLICDWNSDEPLREALNLNAAAIACTSFLEVPPAMVTRLGFTAYPVSMSTGPNVAVRRAHGDFIMLAPADVLFPYQSVTALFALLRGEAAFPADVGRCYLGIERRLIPWQASARLREEDLDRYLLLHTTQMQLGSGCLGAGWHGLAAGEGAHLMAGELWRALRGINENYVLWGATETDLARRAAQSVPQLKADLAGVFCYDFQQRPQLRQAIRYNKDVCSLTTEVNDADWGLGNEDIPRIPAQPCPHVHNSGVPPAPYDNFEQRTAYRWRGMMKGREIDGRLYLELFIKLMDRWLAKRIFQWGVPWFCGEWYGEGEQIKKFFLHAIRERLDLAGPSWGVSSACFALAVLATVGRRRPVRFFHAGGRDLWVAQCAAFVDPTLEITGYDHWQGANEAGNTVSPAMNDVNFQGYYHLESGPMETAWRRLADTPFAGEPYHCFALDLEFWRPVNLVYPDLAPLVADSCAMILGGGAKRREEFGGALIREGFELTALLQGTSVYTRRC
ncbi:MAG: hypothetical protein LBP38_06940 [Desulfovibrio sp.]|jgi:hypothetical protein|nr:hypothetical protein [Desulfovibrio sp.]